MMRAMESRRAASGEADEEIEIALCLRLGRCHQQSHGGDGARDAFHVPVSLNFRRTATLGVHVKARAGPSQMRFPHQPVQKSL